MTVTSLAEIQWAGRYLLLPSQSERIWDLCNGIGSFLLGAFAAPIKIESYFGSDTNQRAAGVLRHNIPLISVKGANIFVNSSSSLQTFQEALPQDLFKLRANIAEILSNTPSDQLPTLIIITAPCTEGSQAGMGLGPSTRKGQVFLAGLEVVGSVLDEYRHRNLAPQHGDTRFAPCGWLFETAPLQSTDDRPGVQELRHIYSITMGEKALDNAALKGSASHRNTEMYTNLGCRSDWHSISSRGRQEPITPLHSILWEGEFMQKWVTQIHGTPRFPDREGFPPARYPKHVRSLGSHNWRAQKLTAQQQAQDALRGDLFTGRQHAIGLSQYNGRLKVPTPEQTECSMGLPEGYTAFTTVKTATGFEVLSCTETERHAMLGDIFDPNLIAATLRDRMSSSISLATALGINVEQPPTASLEATVAIHPEPAPSNSSQRPPSTPGSDAPSICSGIQITTEAKPLAHTRPSQPEAPAAIPEVPIEDMYNPLDPTKNLGENFAKEGVVTCLPAHPA